MPAGNAEPLPNRLPARDRYMRDPTFHTLVDQLRYLMEDAHQRGTTFTPTELREAAMLAAMMYEERFVRPLMVPWVGAEREL